ncbi:MAG: hypothetical protein ACR5KW_01230 [Wolbachia sp.]
MPNVIDKEVNKNLIYHPSVSINEDVANLQKSLQVDKKIDIKENKLSKKNNIDKLLKEKKE